MNRHEIGNRLLNIRNEKGLSRAEVASKADIGTTTLQQWETGSREASIETLAKLAKLYQVSPQWLIFGTPDTATHNDDLANQPPAIHIVFQDDFVLIPMYDIEVSAGNGLFTDGVTQPIKHVAYRRDWLRNKGLDPHHLAVVCNNGDSMEPTIPNSSCMLVNLLKNQAYDGNIYILRLDDRIYVKRTQWIPTGGLRIISDNKLYEPFDLTKDYVTNHLEVCGEVIEISHVVN